MIQQTNEVAEKFLYLRRLIIDEFGMGGADLLAEVDMQLGDLVVDVNPEKYNGRRHLHPFGGLNVC